ncbi:MAG: MBL fold metallo-hydrolase [Acidimicrobiales bacterium]
MSSFSGARIEKVVTSGIFRLDGEEHAVENNVWIVGDDTEVIVVDAAHDPRPIVEAVGDRRVQRIVATHGHNDHINAAVELARTLETPVALHPADRPLWDEVHPNRKPDNELEDGEIFEVSGLSLTVLHTPGHSPGGICLYVPEVRVLFSGDTLFAGGPGATGRSWSSFPDIIESIRTRLLHLPLDTIVHTGHGPNTTIGAEAPHLDEWMARGS